MDPERFFCENHFLEPIIFVETQIPHLHKLVELVGITY